MTHAAFRSFTLLLIIIGFNSCIKDDENDPRAINSTSYPQLSTVAITNVTQTSATAGGVISYDGGGVITSRGVCWSKNHEPTISDDHTSDGSGTGTFSSDVTGLDFGTTYYLRAYATNSAGTAYGTEKTFTTELTLVAGLDYAGGIIFYIDSSGVHGLVCAPTDQSTWTSWGCQSEQIPGADGTLVGTGQSNTNDILADCNTAGIAAYVCDTLSVNGFNDWFLPSRGELLLMYQNLKTAGYGDFSNSSYWSSSEMTATYAWQVVFGTGFTQGGGKSNFTSVRAVRKF